MQSDPRLIQVLNGLLADEMAAIHQYLAHLERARVWGYEKFVAYIEERFADERKHAAALAFRIYQLGGQPSLESTGQVNIAPDLPAGLRADQTAEATAIARYNIAIALAVSVKDDRTREMLETNLKDEDDHLTDIEARLEQIKQTGAQNFLSTQV
jgi:bacterioferritin